MKLLKRITFGTFVLGLLAVLLVSCGAISDELFRALPSGIQLLIFACVFLKTWQRPSRMNSPMIQNASLRGPM